MGSKLPHRGAENNRPEFAKRFVIARVEGFEKDMQICLTPIPSKTRSGDTHAYFPALGACCGLLEYLTVLYRGRTAPPGWKNISAWAQRYMPQPDYDEDKIRVLVDHFRNSIAHRGIATGVWIDRKPGPGKGRRLTWHLTECSLRPSIQIVAEEKALLEDPPWPCSYTHRVHIHLESLVSDIRQGARSYAADVSTNSALLNKFFDCMEDLYPR